MDRMHVALLLPPATEVSAAHTVPLMIRHKTGVPYEVTDEVIVTIAFFVAV